MAEREWFFDIHGCKVVLLATINGLTSEIEIIRTALEKHTPDEIGLSVTSAQLANLRKWNGKEEQEEPDYSDFDLFYIREMSKFGDVLLPSPSHLYTVAAADAAGIGIVALDMDDELYTGLYVSLVTPSSLFLDSISRKRRMRKRLDGTPEEVVLKLDDIAKHPRGIVEVDRKREKHMASEIRRRAMEGETFLAVVDYERSAGVRAFLENEE